MKPYKVAVFNLRMCMKEENRGLKYFKGDNKYCYQRVFFCDLTRV